MSLRDKLRSGENSPREPNLFARFGIVGNPFPASSQTANNPRFPLPVDDEADARIISFLRDNKSQVVVIEGTQGVGKTNFLNHYESEIQEALNERDGYYVVRYLADPEASFDGTIRRLFQEFGIDHLKRLAERLRSEPSAIDVVKNQDMRSALLQISNEYAADQTYQHMMDWLLGFRVLKAHREDLGVQFRLDTVESKTSALRDLVLVSSKVKILNGIFLLLDELEKQDGVLGPTAVVRYLSAMRAIIDALPNHLFMMIAVTPDAMRRYSVALPAFRSRLQNQISLFPLIDAQEALDLAKFYLDFARKEAAKTNAGRGGRAELVSEDDIIDTFERLYKLADRRGDSGVRHREFLHSLHNLAEKSIQRPLS